MIPLGNIPWKLIGVGVLAVAILFGVTRIYAMGQKNAKLELELQRKNDAIATLTANIDGYEEALTRCQKAGKDLEALSGEWQKKFEEAMSRPPRIRVVRETVPVPDVTTQPCEQAVLHAFDYLQELKP